MPPMTVQGTVAESISQLIVPLFAKLISLVVPEPRAMVIFCPDVMATDGWIWNVDKVAWLFWRDGKLAKMFVKVLTVPAEIVRPAVTDS